MKGAAKAKKEKKAEKAPKKDKKAKNVRCKPRHCFHFPSVSYFCADMLCRS